MILLHLLWTFVKIGLFSFGGGYGTIALMEREVVALRGWITIQQFLQLITVSEMTPGPIGINAATFVGFLVAGIPGGVVATMGLILPSFLIMLTLVALLRRSMEREERLATRFFELMRPFALALVLAAAVAVGRRAIFDWTTGLIAVGAFVAGAFCGVHVLLVVIGAGVLGILLHL